MNTRGKLGFRIVAGFARTSDHLVAAFRGKAAPNVADAMGRFHFMDPGMKSRTNLPLCGVAITVNTRPGDNLMVHKALEAAAILENEGVSVEVVDPRSLYPLDVETMVNSVRKTGRAVIVDEGVLRYGATAELAAVIYENAFDYLDAPIVRVGGMETPMPFSSVLEAAVIPSAESIISAVRKVSEEH